MKIAIISDIHGNDIALEQVLLQAGKLKVEKLFVLGDIVGYYYRPQKVMELLNGWSFTFIKGNHEEILSDLMNQKVDPLEIRRKYGHGHQMALKNLSPSQLDFLLTAPADHKEEMNSAKISFYHCNPFDKLTYVYPDAPVEILNKCDNGNDFIFIGHSHYQFIHSFPGKGLLVNVGSVGQSRERGGFATWCLLDTVNRVARLMWTPYETGKLIKEVRELDPELDYLSQVLTRE